MYNARVYQLVGSAGPYWTTPRTQPKNSPEGTFLRPRAVPDLFQKLKRFITANLDSAQSTLAHYSDLMSLLHYSLVLSNPNSYAILVYCDCRGRGLAYHAQGLCTSTQKPYIQSYSFIRMQPLQLSST